MRTKRIGRITQLQLSGGRPPRDEARLKLNLNNMHGTVGRFIKEVDKRPRTKEEVEEFLDDIRDYFASITKLA